MEVDIEVFGTVFVNLWFFQHQQLKISPPPTNTIPRHNENTMKSTQSTFNATLESLDLATHRKNKQTCIAQ